MFNDTPSRGETSLFSRDRQPKALTFGAITIRLDRIIGYKRMSGLHGPVVDLFIEGLPADSHGILRIEDADATEFLRHIGRLWSIRPAA